jgi:hypothetical protein
MHSKLFSNIARTLATAGAALAVTSSLAAATSPAAAGTYPRNWMMPTHLERACDVYTNYPKAGVAARTWPLGAGAHVKVRYNVNGDWALIQDTARANRKPHQINPHYGFIQRSCLARQLPLPALKGIGYDREPRTVRFNPAGNGRRVKTLHVSGNATMRDAVRAFVIGNLSSAYHDTFVVGTRRCVVASRGSFVHGYAPAARRWGYVQASHLPGCHVRNA